MNNRQKSIRRKPKFLYFYDATDSSNVIKQPFTVPDYTKRRHEKKKNQYSSSSELSDCQPYSPISIVAESPKVIDDLPAPMSLGEEHSDMDINLFDEFSNELMNQNPEVESDSGYLFSSDFDTPSFLYDETEDFNFIL